MVEMPQKVKALPQRKAKALPTSVKLDKETLGRTVGSVKKQIVEDCGEEVINIRFNFGGKDLEDSKTIREYGLEVDNEIEISDV